MTSDVGNPANFHVCSRLSHNSTIELRILHECDKSSLALRYNNWMGLSEPILCFKSGLKISCLLIVHHQAWIDMSS